MAICGPKKESWNVDFSKKQTIELVFLLFGIQLFDLFFQLWIRTLKFWSLSWGLTSFEIFVIGKITHLHI